MKLPLRTETFTTPNGKNAARLIAELKEAALSDVRDSANIFAARELLQIALSATSAVKEVNEDDSSVYRDLGPVVEHWPILFNETADLTEYKSLRIGHQLLQSKNPKKRGAGGGLYAFLGKELVSRLDALRIAALLPGDGVRRKDFLDNLSSNHKRRNLDDADETLSPKLLAEWQGKIWTYTPKWAAELEHLPDLTEDTSDKWKTEGQRLFRDVFPSPEKIPELRNSILNEDDKDHASVIRTRIVYRVGKAIISAAKGLEKDV